MNNYCEVDQRYRIEVEKTGEYEYIRSFRTGYVFPDGKVVKVSPYIQVKHKYCGSVYEVRSTSFINDMKRCGKCCGSYENSFAYYIEVELGLKLEDIWDYEKNTLNPLTISKNSNKKVWIKCSEVNYHSSNITTAARYCLGQRCPYCSGHKVHPKDSFAQYHIDNTDTNFLEKYWDYEKNTVNPWEISPSSHKKVWIKCQEKDYHANYETMCMNFTKGRRCSYCARKKVSLYDSFGYTHLDKAMSWCLDNNESPFRVSKASNKKFKFKCDKCGIIFCKNISEITLKDAWCPECSMSKGEKKIAEWLRYNGIEYEYEKEYDGLVGLGGGLLSYDFYLPDYNMLIEYQGEFHDGTSETRKYGQLLQQQEHDRRKREYAKKNILKLLEIWYYDFENIYSILSREI